jgi:hypothetical protein
MAYKATLSVIRLSRQLHALVLNRASEARGPLLRGTRRQGEVVEFADPERWGVRSASAPKQVSVTEVAETGSRSPFRMGGE